LPLFETAQLLETIGLQGFAITGTSAHPSVLASGGAR